MVAASFVAGVRQQRYSEQQEQLLTKNKIIFCISHQKTQKS